MGTRDPRVDAYIAKSADFAKPILTHLRDVVHSTCPDVEEAIKWGHPHFLYSGLFCYMAAFKQHCAFGFWKGNLIVQSPSEEAAMGQFGRITSAADLPSKKVLAGYVRHAMTLKTTRAKSPRPTRKSAGRETARVPDDLAAALAKNAKARRTFEAFPPSEKREYVEWITEAKRDDTRERRLATTLEWLADGKRRNWRYM